MIKMILLVCFLGDECAIDTAVAGVRGADYTNREECNDHARAFELDPEIIVSANQLATTVLRGVVPIETKFHVSVTCRSRAVV